MRILVTGASNKSYKIIATCLEPDSANELKVISRETEGRVAVLKTNLLGL